MFIFSFTTLLGCFLTFTLDFIQFYDNGKEHLEIAIQNGTML